MTTSPVSKLPTTSVQAYRYLLSNKVSMEAIELVFNIPHTKMLEMVCNRTLYLRNCNFEHLLMDLLEVFYNVCKSGLITHETLDMYIDKLMVASLEVSETKSPSYHLGSRDQLLARIESFKDNCYKQDMEAL